jgi:hypothetical protein
MSNWPLAQVAITPLAELGEGAVRIEVGCPAGTTSGTWLPGPAALPVLAVVMASHEGESCRVSRRFATPQRTRAHARDHELAWSAWALKHMPELLEFASPRESEVSR